MTHPFTPPEGQPAPAGSVPPPPPPNIPGAPPPAGAVPPPPPGMVPGLPPQKPGRKAPWWLVALAGLLVLCCCGGAIAAITSDDKPDPKNAAATSSPTPAAATTTPAAAPTTPAPAATTAAAAAAPPPSPKPPAPKVYKGTGDKVVKIGDVSELRIVHFVCKCSSNTVLKSDGPDTLLVNDIGAYNGKMWINASNGALTTRLTVKASGSWTITIGTVDQLALKAPTGSASGKGDNVVILGGSSDTVNITHKRGESNFVVYGYNLETGYGGLLVNEIGGYSGEVELDTPALVQVHADGNWTLKVG